MRKQLYPFRLQINLDQCFTVKGNVQQSELTKVRICIPISIIGQRASFFRGDSNVLKRKKSTMLERIKKATNSTLFNGVGALSAENRLFFYTNRCVLD